MPNLTDLPLARVVESFPETELSILMSDVPANEPQSRRPLPVPMYAANGLDPELRRRGLADPVVSDVLEVIRQIRPIAGDPAVWQRTGRDAWTTWQILVSPLMTALGWTPARVWKEYNRHPGWISAYCVAYPGERSIVVQVQDGSQGLDLVPSWGERYHRRFPEARALAISNGRCYKVFTADAESQDAFSGPEAFLDLVTPTARNPLAPEIAGAAEALCLLAWA